ncbi:MAG TPA: glycosyltransferase family 4 protein, partial [Solirubrobacterales bacterium]|nr:glycosyltransferase family 4 protein [Solirubrobacterales bacterium]
PLAGAERCHTLPYGLDLSPIEAARADFDRAAARAEAGIAEGAELIVCVGTIEPRKAQLLLTQAFEAIAARHPRARLALVGANEEVDSTTLAEYLAVSPLRERIDLIGVTPDVQRWYAMADLFVCASDVESLPRTVLEAMAWETPVLATAVYGLPELIADGESGWLCEPRDLERLVAALDRVLAIPAEERRQVGRAGRALVEERHSLPRYGEQMGALIERAVAGGGPADVKAAE